MSCRALGLFLFSFKAPSSGPLLEIWNHMFVRLIQITIRIALFNFLFIQRIVKNKKKKKHQTVKVLNQTELRQLIFFLLNNYFFNGNSQIEKIVCRVC